MNYLVTLASNTGQSYQSPHLARIDICYVYCRRKRRGWIGLTSEVCLFARVTVAKAKSVVADPIRWVRMKSAVLRVGQRSEQATTQKTYSSSVISPTWDQTRTDRQCLGFFSIHEIIGQHRYVLK